MVRRSIQIAIVRENAHIDKGLPMLFHPSFLPPSLPPHLPPDQHRSALLIRCNVGSFHQPSCGLHPLFLALQLGFVVEGEGESMQGEGGGVAVVTEEGRKEGGRGGG